MERNTPESPLIAESYKSGCAWRLYRIFDFRKGHSRKKLLSNGQHNIGTGTQNISHDEKQTSSDPKRKRSYGCKSISSVQYDSAIVRKKDFPLNERKDERDIVCQKLIAGNYQAKDQARHQSKDLVNALQILYSNKEFFVDILHDPNSVLSDLQDSQSKKMRRKKLMRSKFESRLPELERNCVNEPKDLSKSIASYPSKSGCDPQSPETIVVLKAFQGRGKILEDKLCHLSSQHSDSELSYKESTDEESNISFAQMKKRLRYVGGRRREELNWMAINDESSASYSCQCLENGKNVQSKDGHHFQRCSLHLAKSEEMLEVKDFEARIRPGVASSQRVLPGNSKCSSVRTTKQTDLELHGEVNKHNTKHLYPINEDSEEIKSSQRKTIFSPEFEWYTGSCRGLGREVATRRWGLKGETDLECFNPLKQNMEDLSWSDVKDQHFGLKEFGGDVDVTDELRSDCWSSAGHLKIKGGMQVLSKPKTCIQSERCTMQSSDTTQQIEGVGCFVDSASVMRLSSTPGAKSSGIVQHRAEQGEEQDQQLLNADVSRPPSSREFLSAEVPYQDNHGKLKSCDPNKISSMGMPEYMKASSNLTSDELLFKFQSAHQILGTSLFNELRGLDDELCVDQRLLFDYMNEVLVEVFQYFVSSTPWVSTLEPKMEMFMAERCLLPEMKKRVEWFFLHQQPSPRTLEQHVEKDLAEYRWWLSKYTDIESIGTEIEDDILEDAIMEIVSDMVT